ncbi:hypothetical protein CMI37_31705 [Candidatus Pacearchaeota archaeon]|nr:hypothetical protein [Candidatus Pacearchaeota archaeon]|tara:strand:- start:1565 stop:1921 length:357 start_codon:yes stop_codon:yes gene_type:complete
MSCSYIYDGYTQDGLILAKEGLHDEIRFLFRPKVGRSRAAVYDKMGLRETRADREDVINEAIASAIVEWNVRNGDESTVPPDIEHIEKIHPAAKPSMFEQIMGNKPKERDDQQDAAKN